MTRSRFSYALGLLALCLALLLFSAPTVRSSQRPVQANTPTATSTIPTTVIIDQVTNLLPGSGDPQTITPQSLLFITIDVYAPNVTDRPGQGPGIVCTAVYGQVPSFGTPPTTTSRVTMSYAIDAGTSDRYGATIGPLPEGLYDYTAECSGDGGTSWTRASSHGQLTVTSGQPTSTATPTVPPTASPSPTPSVTVPATPLPTATRGPGVTINRVGKLEPAGADPRSMDSSSTLYVSVDVLATSVTDKPGQGKGIICSLHFGQVSTFGGLWTNSDEVPMSYVSDAGDSDRYGTNLGPLPPGLYQFTAWCSGNGGFTKVWADTFGTGGPGRLTVYGSAQTPANTTPMPQPTSLPQPQDPCTNLLANGSFEFNYGWHRGATPRQPSYATGPSPVPDGMRTMRLGIDPNGSLADVASYSSIGQRVTIPPTTASATISFQYYPLSEATSGGQDRQELILLDPLRQNETIAILWRVTENDRTWKSINLSVDNYRGRTVVVYFNAQNDGDGLRTAMYLDDVRLFTCQLPPPSATVTSSPSPQVTVTPSPSLQPVPSQTVIFTPGPPGDIVTPGMTVVPFAGTMIAPVPTTTQAPTATATPARRQEIPERERPLISDILPDLGPWALLCLLGVIVLITIAILAQVFGSG
jgi:hypothetical protein